MTTSPASGLAVKGWLECSFLDWPGKLAGVVFLPGCSFRCPFCHNGPLVEAFADLPDISLDRVIDHYRGLAGWIDGVVVTGGEPTIHPRLPEYLEAFRAAGLEVKLDTNGSRPDVLDALIDARLVDHVAMDVKAPPDPGRYRQLSGVAVDVEAIRRSARLIVASGLEHTFRATVIPGEHAEDDLLAMDALTGSHRPLRLQAFRPGAAMDPAWRDRPGLDDGELARLQRLVDAGRTASSELRAIPA